MLRWTLHIVLEDESIGEDPNDVHDSDPGRYLNPNRLEETKGHEGKGQEDGKFVEMMVEKDMQTICSLEPVLFRVPGIRLYFEKATHAQHPTHTAVCRLTFSDNMATANGDYPN
jgi:hypothetical protein